MNQINTTRKKIRNYFFNSLLIIIVLILIVPSWRISFQGWFQGLFMNEVEFVETNKTQIPEAEQKWALFDLQSNLHNFQDFKNDTRYIEYDNYLTSFLNGQNVTIPLC